MNKNEIGEEVVLSSHLQDALDQKSINEAVHMLECLKEGFSGSYSNLRLTVQYSEPYGKPPFMSLNLVGDRIFTV
jgi:hypothetical protein